MKRVLNLNGIASRFVAAILALTLLVPGALWLLGRLFPTTNITRLGRISLGAGLVLLGLFALLVVLELAQDAGINAQHRRSLGKRLPPTGKTAECLYCGSRQVRSFDRACPVCGKDLS